LSAFHYSEGEDFCDRTVTIHLPDEQVESLKAKAAAQGLRLEAWFERLAAEETPEVVVRSTQAAAARILEIQKRVKPDPDGWTVRYIDHGRR
jgi:hypothetical protein